jgi:hypothetical protein
MAGAGADSVSKRLTGQDVSDNIVETYNKAKGYTPPGT